MNNSSTHITITFSRGWLVAIASTGMGLVLGILYVWSVIKAGIPDSWGWSNADKALPYSIMTIAFSAIMVPAGKLQDRYGPRPVIALGGFLAGLGCLICGLGGSSITAFIVGFGIISGAGVGFGDMAQFGRLLAIDCARTGEQESFKGVLSGKFQYPARPGDIDI